MSDVFVIKKGIGQTELVHLLDLQGVPITGESLVKIVYLSCPMHIMTSNQSIQVRDVCP